LSQHFVTATGVLSGPTFEHLQNQTLRHRFKTNGTDRLYFDVYSTGNDIDSVSGPLSFYQSSYSVGVSLSGNTGKVLRPTSDNDTKLGNASFRWSEVFAGNGTINTSDAREKFNIEDIGDKELKVARKLKKIIKKFKFKDSVLKKGDCARIHFGVIAQEVISVFESENLDPMQYGIVCHDAWGDSDEVVGYGADGEQYIKSPKIVAGDRFGIRYDELICFILSAM
jgi:hypothetical protein